MPNNCSSCGAPNDPLLVSCCFCKAQLQKVDLSSISNEDLLLNAAEWVGRTSMRYYTPPPPTGAGAVASIMASARIMQNDDICAMAEKYLTILEVRAAGSTTLSQQHDKLQARYANRKATGKSNEKRLIIGVIIGLIAIIAMFVLVAVFAKTGK